MCRCVISNVHVSYHCLLRHLCKLLSDSDSMLLYLAKLSYHMFAQSWMVLKKQFNTSITNKDYIRV